MTGTVVAGSGCSIHAALVAAYTTKPRLSPLLYFSDFGTNTASGLRRYAFTIRGVTKTSGHLECWKIFIIDPDFGSTGVCTLSNSLNIYSGFMNFS